MEPGRDFILVRDGDGPEAPVLAKLTGSKPPQFVVSTGNQLYVYIQTDQADSRRGFRIKYYEGNEGARGSVCSRSSLFSKSVSVVVTLGVKSINISISLT